MIRIGKTEYYSVSDVADTAGLSRQTIDRYIQSGTIQAPVLRAHGRRKKRTYTEIEFQSVLEQIKSFRAAQNIVPDPPPKNPPPPKRREKA
jgi:DNA-binding transcriptional MerR regulator